MLELQLVLFPQSNPAHDHIQFGHELVTLEGVPIEQRLVDGAVVEVVPVALPHTPSCPNVAVGVELVLSQNFVLTKFPQRLARAPVFPAATMNDCASDPFASARPEYAATIPEAKAIRSASELGSDPEEKASLGRKAVPESDPPCKRKLPVVVSEMARVPDAAMMLGTARMCTLLPVLTRAAIPL